jgi:hypothetical protein
VEGKFMQDIIEHILNISPSVRYVALYYEGKLQSVSRSGLSDASSAESDKYEELLVNPTLLTLVSQRGKIDCGGLDYVLIRYRNFFEFVVPVDRGHVSIGMEPAADPLTFVPKIIQVISHLRSD